MRFLAALALLVLGVANAHHTEEHQLKYPEFVLGKTLLYDVTIRMTSGVPGMSPQVAKAVIQTELKVYAKTTDQVYIQMHKVQVSNSLASTESSTDKLTLKSNKALEDLLNIPIIATFENGLIKSYTLSPRESLESEKIKRTVLRNLEIYLDRHYLEGGFDHHWPLTYNVSRPSPAGNYSSHYVVTSSPYVDFPKELNVFNISRTDNFEVIPYLAYKTHHNFAKQGCPEVCKESHPENRYGAGCPTQHEPYHTPMKRSFVQHHNLRMKVLEGKSHLLIDSVETKETHVADVYDQNMEVTVRTTMRYTKTTPEVIPDPTGQQVFTDLNNLEKEIHETEIEQLCRYPDTNAAISEVKTLLDKVADIVLKDDIKEEKSKQVGEMLITMQKAMQTLKLGDFRKLQAFIKNYDELESASDKEKVKRQIWLDLLPVIGTSESVSFIVYLVTENMNLPNKAISLWESKSILEALPHNIHRPDEHTISQLSHLLELIKDPKTPGYTIFYSAAHMTMARVISKLCAESTRISKDSGSDEERYSFRYLQRNLRNGRPEQNEFRNNMARTCPETKVKSFIEQIAHQLDSTNDKVKRVIYIETLARTGLDIVLPILRPYVYGQQEHLDIGSSKTSYHGYSHSYVDYLKTVSIYALHNIVDRSPRAVQELLVPVFFNKTEPPKVRTAAFSVVIASQPSLGLLQHIAEQSWKEPSEEVGSYVTSSLETYGNSSQPCNQLIASRIKKVLPQLKRVDRGQQKAKNILWDFWDEFRGFGFDKRFDFTPSNESFIPSVLYGSLGYNADTLKDYFFQYAFNAQGLTSRNVYDALLKRFGLKPSEDIPKQSESEIFPELDIVNRDPEFWRITTYESVFYSTSYYYFDGEESTHQDMFNLIMDQFKHYITKDTHGNFNGHLIKVFIPSSYHAKTISQALPYPVQFEIKNPLLLSLKIKVEKTVGELNQRSRGFGFDFHLSPSVYYSSIYTNEILNLGDCKKVGVYHEKKGAASYPVVISLSVHSEGKFCFGYRFPNLPKDVCSYRTEAGTYAGKNYLAPLPPTEDRRTIKTLPSMFVKTISWGVPGLPRFAGEIRHEDIQFGMEDTPRNTEEAILYAVRRFRNAGWRRKSIDVSRVSDSVLWVPNTEVKVHVNYSRNYISPKTKSSEADWSKDLKFDDKLDTDHSSEYSAEGQKIYHKLSKTLSHIKDVLKVKVEHRVKSTVVNKADLSVEYSHTLGGFLHFVHFNASAALPKIFAPIAITADYAVAFVRRPNEFKYSELYGKQKGLALAAVSFSKSAPFANPFVVSKAVFDYKPLHQVLHMDPPVEPKEYEPETHEECLKDVRNGESHSVACVKAIREKSIYNHLKMHTIYLKETPEYANEIGEKIDLALKHTFFSHMRVTRKPLSLRPKGIRKSIHLEATYIDKMTDEPVVDIVLDKPYETLNFSKISVGKMQPLSSIETLAETYAAAFTNNTYPATCSLMDKYVRTYDMMSYHLPTDTPACTYVLSTHCTEHKKFAVLVKYSPEASGTQEIHMYVGKDEIVLVPGTKWTYKVRYNGHEQTVRPLEPRMLSESALITALVNVANDGSGFVEIYARKAGLKVRYDGVHVKVQVHPRYKGELCGLCSEFNGEIVREYKGVNRCLYTHPWDFAKSSIIGTCTDKTPGHPYLCNDDQVSYSWRQENSHQEEWQMEGYEPTIKRNIVLNRVSELCFSTKPVPMCNDNSEPSETESQEIDFHCLPKMDANARKMVTESKRRILGELETKTVDHTETIEVAQKC